MGAGPQRSPETISLVTSADDSTFSEFYRREFAVQVRRAALLVGSDEVAHDIVQNAFIGLYRRWGTLDSPGGYLSRSVVNGCRDAARRRASQKRLSIRLVDRAREPDTNDVLADVL